MKLQELRELANVLAHPSDMYDQQEIMSRLQEQGIEPGNFYQELQMSSRFADTHRDVSYSNTSVSLHSHTFYEILYCCNTCGAEYLVESDRYRLQRGDIVIVPPGVSHRPLLPAQMEIPYKRYVVWISGEAAKNLQQQFPDDGLYYATGIRLLRTAGTKWEYLGSMFRRGVEEAEKQKPGWEMMVFANTMELIVHICRALQERSAAPLKAEKPELMDQVMAYVEANLGKKITLEDISKRFWVSQSTITQTFRNKMGVSFYRCVTQRRLIAAKSMIMEGMQLERVGMQVGFSDYSTFYRAFKQEYGISPRQYRKLQDADETSDMVEPGN